jgi:hypothetical protein
VAAVPAVASVGRVNGVGRDVGGVGGGR